MNAYTWTLLGTGIAFLATTLGSAAVFLIKKESQKLNIISMGFASGIMIAAAVWSLLIPSIEMVNNDILPASIGFMTGGIFLYILDRIIPHFHPNASKPEGLKSSFDRSTMMLLAVTLHNIPEGMAMGLAFALASQASSVVSVASAMALAIGIAIQNLPEGAAISLPIYQQGEKRIKAFALGMMSGIVEPIAGVITVALIGTIQPLLPYFLSFAAGAMVYVVVEELIPESQNGDHGHAAVFSFMIGFVIMMVLDVLLG